MAEITIGKSTRTYDKGTTYEDIAKEYQKDYKYKIAAVILNGKIRELMRKANKDGELKFITIADGIGHKTYVRTAQMILCKAVYDIAPSPTKTKIEFSVGNGYYCTFHCDYEITDEFVKKVANRFREIVVASIPVVKKTFPLDDAIEVFAKQDMTDKINLIKYRRSSEINIYNIDGFYDYFYGYMLPNTSYVQYFEIEKYRDGLMLILPPDDEPDKIVRSDKREKVTEQQILSTKWGNLFGIDNVGDLNNAICQGKTNDLILVQEALQERRIGEIALHIKERPHVKFVMIAGPSSSGKTTFANRLSIQLRTYGLVPHLISLDNYFVNREMTPLNKDGSYNFECLEAIDVEQFNKDMTKLLNGEAVELPVFNFISGKREYNGDIMKLGPEDVLVIEGIHGLNDKMSYSLPADSKYRVYISALTTLNIDNHNRIPTTDGRLLRRIVRDARTRGSSAKHTISMWKSVRAGEEQNIFPFQESADEMFNSAQIYELAVLKHYAEPLLFQITKSEPEYYEAKRLLKFLDYFVSVDSESLPRNSICREFVGGSCFNV
ncbi:MAG: nucleoside kinase [Butyrivibrio sp.]|nr:nucleoside kinase [Butyrivibrio sp.]